jgi:hypothetical protein
MDSIQYIIRQARRRNLDPNAVLAVARQEGLGGGVGDQGTSFGPWQLHAGGALPAGIRNPQQWAWSPAGINYALDRIAGVAAGKRGQAAVQAIVTGFERPANPGREIAGASRAYGRAAGPGRALAASAFDTSSVGRPQPPRRAAASSPGLDVSGIINLTNSIVGLPPVPIQVNLPGRQTAAPPRRLRRASVVGPGPVGETLVYRRGGAAVLSTGSSTSPPRSVCRSRRRRRQPRQELVPLPRPRGRLRRRPAPHGRPATASPETPGAIHGFSTQAPVPPRTSSRTGSCGPCRSSTRRWPRTTATTSTPPAKEEP